MQEYRSGHNEAVLKTVGLTARGFESLFLRHKRKTPHCWCFFFYYGLVREDSHTLLYCETMQMGCGYERKAMGACSREPSEVRWCSQRIPMKIIKIRTVGVKKPFGEWF